MHLDALTADGRRLFPHLARFPGFVLGGGTALALQIGHRRSADFDLFAEPEIEKHLLAKVKRVFAAESVTVAVNNPDELTVFAGAVKMTFLRYPFRRVAPLARYRRVPLFRVEELAAMKAYTVGRRAEYKDYIDLYAVLAGGYVTLPRILTLARKKYGADFNDRLFLEQLLALNDVEESALLFLSTPITRSALRRRFESDVRKLAL